MTIRLKFLLSAFVLLLITLFFYLPTLQYDFIILDDFALVVNNADIKGLDLARLIKVWTKPYLTLFVPLTMLSYMLDYQLWGLTAYGFKFVNLVLHFLNATLVFYMLITLLKRFDLGLFVAVLFIMHPLQIESVVWIAERKNVLSSLFFLLAFVFYMRATPPRSEECYSKPLIASCITYFFALLSKPSVVVFPLIILVYNVFFRKNQHVFIKRSWFYLLILLAALLISFTTIMGTAAEVVKYQYHGGSYLTNFYVVLTVLWRYLGLLFYPINQNILYLSFRYDSLFYPAVISPVIGILILLGVAYFFRKKLKDILFWLAWSLILWFPMSNLVIPFPSIMNDRYMYLPLVGFFIAFFLLAERLLLKLIKIKYTVLIMRGLFLIVVLHFGILFKMRAPHWLNSQTLLTEGIKRAPVPDARLYFFSANEYLRTDQFDKAIPLLRKSLFMSDQYDTRLSLAIALTETKQYEEAEMHCKRVLEEVPKNDIAYNSYAVLLRKTKRFSESKIYFEKAIDLAPGRANIRNDYALLLLDLNLRGAAIKQLHLAIQLDPDRLITLYNLAQYYKEDGDLERAREYALQYLNRHPTGIEMLMLANEIQNKIDNALMITQ